MTKRTQPYIPLYVQDFLTDEKLMECTAQATGVYIRIMCLMHKSDPYGTIVLKEKDKNILCNAQNNVIYWFAYKLSRHFPYTVDVIYDSLIELTSEGVLQIEGDILYQKRMVQDSQLSKVRSRSGRVGAESKHGKSYEQLDNNTEQIDAKDDVANSVANDMANIMAKNVANSMANAEYEYENENENEKWIIAKNKFLKNSENWKKQFMEKKGLSSAEMDKLMTDFIEMLELRRTLKPLPALYTHFANHYEYTKNNSREKVRTGFKSKFGDVIKDAGARFGEFGNAIGKEIT